MDQISHSLDVSESLAENKEVDDNMVKTNSGESEKKEDKPVEKKTAKPAEKKKNAPKKKKKDNFDDDFDDESDMGVYLFWIVVLVIVAILALWLFTDWKICLQF